VTSFSDRDFTYVLETVTTAAAAEILPRFRRLEAGDIQEKSSAVDLVTQADLRSEAHIVEALERRFPSALIVGEESHDPNRSIEALRDCALGFTIDPVDGTYNFASGLPVFGTIVSVVAHGETIAGLIYDCIHGDCLTASKGAGAFITHKNGRANRVAVARPAALADMVGTVGWAFMDEPSRSQIAANLAKIRMPLTVNCSAYEYWMMARGGLHVSGHGKASPWDHLAGVLIHQEAGGYTARFDGSPYRPGDMLGGILSAPDRESFEVVRREIIGIG
jgi:fructose-1,6-bisphosphatase/inositol monophosphatase family enzyme